MLFPAQVQPFLLHDVERVRKHALRYFPGAHDPAPVTADDLWACIDRFPSTRRRCLDIMTGVPATERSIERLLGELRRFPWGDDPDRWRLGRLARGLPPDAARRALADSALAARLPEDVGAAMERTIAFSEQTFDQLLRALP